MASDDLTRAIGEVTIEASYLEYCVAVLVSHANKNSDEDVGKILSQTGGPLRELRQLLDLVEMEKTDWPHFYSALSELRDRLSKALDKRNRLVHSVEVMQLSSNDPFPIDPRSWHPKSGDVGGHASVEEVQQLVSEMRHIGGWFLRRLHTARSWAQEHQQTSVPDVLTALDPAQVSSAPQTRTEDIAQALAIIRNALEASDKPLVSGSVAHAVSSRMPQMRENHWAGAGRFGNFVEKYAPDIIFIRRGPGYICDPSRHNEADLPDT